MGTRYDEHGRRRRTHRSIDPHPHRFSAATARPGQWRILDLFCKQGGAAEGYARAGMAVTGVDLVEQRRYPYPHRRADALAVLADEQFLAGFHAVHASPPCQAFSRLTRHRDAYPDLVAATRAALVRTGLPYVIENVPGAPLHAPVQLCGSSFGLRVRRHRLFEVNFPLVAPPCDHSWQDQDPVYLKLQKYRDGGHAPRWAGTVGVWGHGCGLGPGEVEVWADAMEIDWMDARGLAQAIPPAYTAYIGARLARHLVDQLRRAARPPQPAVAV